MKQLESKPEKIECRKHPTISQVQIIDNKPNFPISWMNIQGYCEYSIYLEHFQHIHVGQTKKMKNGTKAHNKLEADFKEEAQIKPLDEIIDISRTQKVISREFFVVSSEYGIRGFIDEIWLEPDKIVIIDDKPGSKAYYSMIHQVYAYALAYKQYITDDRPIEVALRTSTTGNIFWKEEFTQKAQEEIISIINHMQRLITGEDEFIPTDNPNKCRSCRFNMICSNNKNRI